MQVAVADVPVADDARARRQFREAPFRRRDELGQRRDRQRDVVLDRRAFARLRFRDVLAEVPQRVALRQGMAREFER
mgnify:CR=1 FL=1